ncbi:AEC family transporter [Acinetobacter sichuanensis]|uniref:AEC family transporter n=1 Tax=Acinetobacter sichuanensis TaxID=2136183 RepID=UPI00280DD0CE|nr:AEC family transporter [Acinetobacter sichuanensis]MDQ9022954.1 AEC family transporter [Acinetobacter sichuanensis]
MLEIFSIVLPIFLIIFLGYLSRASGKLGEHAASELNKAVVWIFLPALLFKICATSHISEVWNTGFVISYVMGCILVFFAILFWRLAQKYHLVVASIDGLSAAYANTGYIGIPLCVLIFGEFGLKPAMIATLVVVVAVFAVAVTFIEFALQKTGNVVQTITHVFWALLKNPIVIAPILGFMWAATGYQIATPLMHLLDMLAIATSPCALISLGLFLAKKQTSVQTRSFIPLVVTKLIVQPLITAFFAIVVFKLPTAWAHSAIILSALPTGTGPYMLAELYKTDAKTISQSILWSTILSIISLSVLLTLFNS